MMKLSRLLLAAPAILLAGCGGTETKDTAKTEPAPQMIASNGITADGLARQIATLASDEFGGRAPATPGGSTTRKYIANEYERLGLEKIGNSYEHKVPLVSATLNPETSQFTINANDEISDLTYKEDIVYWTKRVQENITFDNSDVVFVGYGIVAPEYGWDDYKDIDVTGKTVVILVNDPGYATQDPELFNGNSMTYYGRWTYKYEEAARQGAAAALVIHQTKPAAYGWNVVEASWTGGQLDLGRSDNGASRVIAEGWLSHDAAHALFDDAGLDLDTLYAQASTGSLSAVPLEGVTASATLNTAIRHSESANVVGVLPGATSPDEYVLYMGHWDHFGTNEETEGDDKIFNGAVDNATGVAAILEIAKKFTQNTTPPARSILFATVTGEEFGLLGSAHMGESPPVPLKQIVAGINIDAMLPAPLAKDIIVVGHGASELEDILKTVADKRDRYLRPDAEPEKGYFYRSDHISLAKKGVPMLYADSGIDLHEGGEEAGLAFAKDYTENRYHTPKDDYNDEWNLTGMLDTVEVLYETGEVIAYSDIWPNWYEGNEFRALRDAQLAGE